MVTDGPKVDNKDMELGPSITTSEGDMTTTAPQPHLEALQRDGFVVVRSILPPDQVSMLREAAAKVTSMTRAGQWPYLRSVPKQFPPWPNTPPPSSEGGIWGVQHLMHPEMPDREKFIKAYFSPRILAVAEELLGISANETHDEELLVMEHYTSKWQSLLAFFESEEVVQVRTEDQSKMMAGLE